MMVDVIKEFERKIKNLKEYIVLVVVNAKNYQKVNINILKNLIKVGNTPGVYITLNKPFRIMQKIFENENIDTRMIIFIDAISAEDAIKKIENCLYIGSPEKLSDMGVAVDQAIKALPTGEKFLFLDSLSTLLIYNRSGTVARFVHFLAGKMRVLRVKGVIISLEKKSDEALLNELTQFCDIRLDF